MLGCQARESAPISRWTASSSRILSASSGTWSLAYTLQAGLNLGVPDSIKDYPAGNMQPPGFRGRQPPTV